MPLCGILLVLALCSCAPPAPFIFSLYPPRDSSVQDSIVTVKFRVAEPIDMKSFSAASLRVAGTRTGNLTVNVRYARDSGDVVITILDSLHRDERVYVAVTEDLRLADGSRIPEGIAWYFWAGVQRWQLTEVDRDTNTTFVEVDELPEPIGGIAAIQSEIVYPDVAKRAGIEGTVFVETYIDEAGMVTKTIVVRGIGGGCDEAAVEAIRQIMFKPGRQEGKPVKVRMSIPIRFRLAR